VPTIARAGGEECSNLQQGVVVDLGE
jgi:hypothetical protein